MDDEKIEQTFVDALNLYDQENPDTHISIKAARYFFFAGSEFRLQAAREMHEEIEREK